MNDSPRFDEKFYKEKLCFARERVAKAWCQPHTQKIEMNVVLGEEFAKILVQEMYTPHLGCATTAELIDEVRARIGLAMKLDYIPIIGEEQHEPFLRKQQDAREEEFEDNIKVAERPGHKVDESPG